MIIHKLSDALNIGITTFHLHRANSIQDQIQFVNRYFKKSVDSLGGHKKLLIRSFAST